MDIKSSKMASQDVPKLGPLKDPVVKATGPGASLDRGSTSFARPPSTHGVALAPTTPTGGGASTILSLAGAPGANPPS
jgi:hypothetical protein